VGRRADVTGRTLIVGTGYDDALLGRHATATISTGCDKR
jgi:hypothetical protein